MTRKFLSKEFLLKSTLLAVSLTLFMPTSADIQEQDDPDTSSAHLTHDYEDVPAFRLMTYNIRNGKGMDNHTDYKRTAREIIKSGADFVAIQEADSMTSRSHERYVLGELALETQMYPIFGKARNLKKGSYGVGLLCKTRPVRHLHIPLPGREEKRTLLVAEFKDFYLACTHWSLNEADRMTSASIIRQTAAKLDNKPFILAGDFNATPDSKEMNMLSEDFILVNRPDAFTFPADKPNRTIDYIAVWKPTAKAVYWNNKHTRVLESRMASDHRPVVADFMLKTPEERFWHGKPYLQNPSSNGITIMCQTRRPSHCWIELTTDSLLAATQGASAHKIQNLVNGQAACHDIEQKFRLNGLTPGVTYYYRVCGREVLENQAYFKAFGDTVRTSYFRFTLPDERTDNFTALVLNDMHCQEEIEEKMAELARNIPHDIVFFNGDCLPEPKNREEAMKHVNRLCERFDGSTHPLFFVRGNHEIRNAYSSGMPSLFDNPNHIDASGNLFSVSYGAFNWGDNRFVYLDSGEDKPDDTWVYYGLNDFPEFRKQQAEFLVKEISSRAFRQSDRRILLSHIPVWGNTDSYQPTAGLWQPVLKKASWDIALFGHTHEFRFYEKNDCGNPCPTYIGGGNQLDNATMAVIKREKNKMHLTIYNAEGRILRIIDLS